MLIVATARPEIAPTLLPDFQRVVLAGLPRQALRTIARSVLGDDPHAEQSAEEIARRSGGNPYFAEELALAVREGSTSLPVSIEAAVQARLDALPRAEKDLLRCASVLGRRFWVEALPSRGVPDPRADDAVRVLEEGLRLARSTGNRVVEGYVRHNLGLALARSGRVEDGRREELAALELARELDLGHLRAACRCYQALIELEDGQPETALVPLDDALAMPGEHHLEVAPGLRAFRSSALLALGRTEEPAATPPTRRGQIRRAARPSLATPAEATCDCATRHSHLAPLAKRGSS